MLKICAFSCIYIAKSGLQRFLCAYFFLQKLFMLIGHVLIKMSVVIWIKLLVWQLLKGEGGIERGIINAINVVKKEGNV